MSQTKSSTRCGLSSGDLEGTPEVLEATLAQTGEELAHADGRQIRRKHRRGVAGARAQALEQGAQSLDRAVPRYPPELRLGSCRVHDRGGDPHVLPALGRWLQAKPPRGGRPPSQKPRGHGKARGSEYLAQLLCADDGIRR